METILEYFLKSAGVLSIFVLVYHFLLRRLTFFQANRWFLIGGIVASMTFPLVEITQTIYIEQPLQEEYYYTPQEFASPMAVVLEQPSLIVETPFDYWQLFGFLYVAVVLFFLSKMLVELSSLYKLIKSGHKTRNGKFVMVTLSRKLTPFSFFNYICYSETEKSSTALDLIMDHEKVHARQWHSVDVLLSHLYKAIFWINPLAWLLKKQIGENLEFIADAEAKTQAKGISYERTLLSSAAFHLQPSLANNFFTPFIKKRIMMLQKEASARWNMYKYALILPVIVVFLYSFNVVTEVEYVENQTQSQMEMISDDDITYITINQFTSIKDLKQIESIMELIHDYNYQIIATRDNKGLITHIEFTYDSPNSGLNNYKTFLSGTTEMILKIEGDKITLENGDYGGIYYLSDEVSNGDEKLVEAVYVKSKDSLAADFYEVLATWSTETQKADLNAIKKELESNYDIKLEYFNQEFKDGNVSILGIHFFNNQGRDRVIITHPETGNKSICLKYYPNLEAAKQFKIGSCLSDAALDARSSKIIDYRINDNIVTPHEYRIAVATGDYDKEFLNGEETLARYNVNKLTSNAVSKQKEDQLIFDITLKTTDEQLIVYAKKISDFANYKVRFSDQERDENNALKRLSISTKFPGKKWDKNITIGTKPFELLLIKAGKETLSLNDNTTKETFYVNKDDVEISTENWTYGAINNKKVNDFNWNKTKFKEGTITIKITATTTKAELENHKQYLKESHNVDFNYSKLKYKKDKLVGIKINLNDNRGTQLQQAFKNNTPIRDICIQGFINDNNKLWKMNSCEDVPKVTYSLGNVQYIDSPQNDSLINYYQPYPKGYSNNSLNNYPLPAPQFEKPQGIRNVTKPLVIIDGVINEDPFYERNIKNTEIESMTVLKNSDATSLYGEAGKNGVIIITTDKSIERTTVNNQDKVMNNVYVVTNGEKAKLLKEEGESYLFPEKNEKKSTEIVEYEIRQDAVDRRLDKDVPQATFQLGPVSLVKGYDSPDAVYLYNDVIISRKEFQAFSEGAINQVIKMSPKTSARLLNDFYAIKENQYLVILGLYPLAQADFLLKKNKDVLYKLNNEEKAILDAYAKEDQKLQGDVRRVKRAQAFSNRKDLVDSVRNASLERFDARKAALLKRKGLKDSIMLSRSGNDDYRRELLVERNHLRDSVIYARKNELEIRREQLTQQREDKLNEYNKRRDSLTRKVNQPNSSFSELESSDTLFNFNEEMLQKYGEKVKAKGYSFKIKTFKESNGKVIKLKLEFDGTTYTVATNNGIEKLTFDYYKDGSSPKMTSVTK